MLDTETLGTKQHSAFISIGAVQFDPNTGALGETFYENIDWDDALKTRTATGETIRWWMRQSKEAQNRVCAPGRPLKEVLASFGKWFRKETPDRCIWGNGACFDVAMLENAYEHTFGVLPWKHWNVRDVRTIVDLAEGIVGKQSVPFEGTQHDALADAIHQAKYVAKMWAAMRNNR
jgi:inhibitor of KinA sporulation pathway (predicted exonuclease)